MKRPCGGEGGTSGHGSREPDFQEVMKPVVLNACCMPGPGLGAGAAALSCGAVLQGPHQGHHEPLMSGWELGTGGLTWLLTTNKTNMVLTCGDLAEWGEYRHLTKRK